MAIERTPLIAFTAKYFRAAQDFGCPFDLIRYDVDPCSVQRQDRATALEAAPTAGQDSLPGSH
jgi:hypothetical protein